MIWLPALLAAKIVGQISVVTYGLVLVHLYFNLSVGMSIPLLLVTY